MDIEKLVEQVANEVYNRLNANGGNVSTYGSSAAAGNGAIAPSAVAKMIDHTILKADTNADDIKKLCSEAAQYNFASVCVNPYYVPLARQLLNGTGVKTCCVIGFPIGSNTTETKIFETIDACNKGAQEVDMVINVAALKNGDWDYVKKDIEGVVNAAKGKALVKVIIETNLLTDEEKVKVCTISKLAGADFVKTSTGFVVGKNGSASHATVEDVKLMRQTVGPVMGVKASGGVRDYATACKMIEAGATRFGTSGGIKIVSGAQGGASSSAPSCIGCGKCTQTCPTGHSIITKTMSY